MTPDEQSFLQTIIQNPDSDAPRLVFADWLEEHGQEDRCEFIRIQIELARLGSPRVTFGDSGDAHNHDEGSRYRCHLTQSKGGPDYYDADSSHFAPAGSRVDVRRGIMKHGKWVIEVVHGLRVVGVKHGIVNGYVLARDGLSVPFPAERFEALHRRERELLDGALLTWNNYPGWMKEWQFRRGFVEVITCAWADFLANHAAIRAACPLRFCNLTTRPDDLDVGDLIRGTSYDRFCGLRIGDRTVRKRIQFLAHPLEARDRIIGDLLEAAFPGLKFTLPLITPPAFEHDHGYGREAMMR